EVAVARRRGTQTGLADGTEAIAGALGVALRGRAAPAAETVGARAAVGVGLADVGVDAEALGAAQESVGALVVVVARRVGRDRLVGAARPQEREGGQRARDPAAAERGQRGDEGSAQGRGRGAVAAGTALGGCSGRRRR